MSDPVIEISGLTRYFGAKAAVQQVSFTVRRGCVFGFLGRNGSGKTTTIRMLLVPKQAKFSGFPRNSVADR